VVFCTPLFARPLLSGFRGDFLWYRAFIRPIVPYVLSRREPRSELISRPTIAQPNLCCMVRCFLTFLLFFFSVSLSPGLWPFGWLVICSVGFLDSGVDFHSQRGPKSSFFLIAPPPPCLFNLFLKFSARRDSFFSTYPIVFLVWPGLRIPEGELLGSSVPQTPRWVFLRGFPVGVSFFVSFCLCLLLNASFFLFDPTFLLKSRLLRAPILFFFLQGRGGRLLPAVFLNGG